MAQVWFDTSWWKAPTTLVSFSPMLYLSLSTIILWSQASANRQPPAYAWPCTNRRILESSRYTDPVLGKHRVLHISCFHYGVTFTYVNCSHSGKPARIDFDPDVLQGSPEQSEPLHVRLVAFCQLQASTEYTRHRLKRTRIRYSCRKLKRKVTRKIYNMITSWNWFMAKMVAKGISQKWVWVPCSPYLPLLCPSCCTVQSWTPGSWCLLASLSLSPVQALQVRCRPKWLMLTTQSTPCQCWPMALRTAYQMPDSSALHYFLFQCWLQM